MSRRRLAGLCSVFGFAACLLVAISPTPAQQIHRNSFETMKMGWVKGGFDAPYQETTHTISDQVFHEGRYSEYLRLDVQPGSYIHYVYPAPGKAVIGDELTAGLWLKANRPGMQLLARVVLPRQRDPQNIDHLMTTYIRGDTYQKVGQWTHLELTRPTLLLKKQQQLLQQQYKEKNNVSREFDFTDAYIDGLILNVYGGPGATEVWIDDVEIGPLTATNAIQGAVTTVGPKSARPIGPYMVPRPDSKIAPTFEGTNLKVAGRPFMFRGIVRIDTPVDKLREARFNTVFLPTSTDPAVVREASDRGLWVVPMLRVLDKDNKPLPADQLAGQLTRFNEADKLMYVLGNTLRYEQTALITQTLDTVKQLDPAPQAAIDVSDGIPGYSHRVKILGVHRWPLMTTLELPRYREWLQRQHNLADPGVLLWTSVQTHLPDEVTQALYERPSAGAFDEPIGPQAEHVQILTYTALGAGCRGLQYSFDRFLADSHWGRDRLLACALANLEMEMLEPLLAAAEDVPEWVDTSSPDVKAAVIRSKLGVLVLPVWEGPFSQFVPGQAAINKLHVYAPPMPSSMQAWEISPADVRHLQTTRLAGSTKVTLPEFGLTAAIVFTTNNELLARFQEQAKGRRQLAAQWAHDMAAYELDKVLQVHDQLVLHHQTAPDAASLIADAQRRLRDSQQLWASRAFPEAYLEAQRALRPLRILMRAEWEKAVRGTDSPVVTPYTASFFTLPKHWQLVEQMQGASWGANVLPGGDFESLPQRPEEAWRLFDPMPLDEVELIPQRVSEVDEPTLKKDDPVQALKELKMQGPDRPRNGDRENRPHVEKTIKAAPHEGKLCAMLKIEPRKGAVPPIALERTVLALSSPEVRLQPGTVVRISAWVCIPKRIAASPDGALLYDNSAGDAFAIRLLNPMPWKQFTIYRRVPSSGVMQLTLALTGVGTVYFDDIRMEPLQPSGGAAAQTASAPMR
jgi:hypothetical protein